MNNNELADKIVDELYDNYFNHYKANEYMHEHYDADDYDNLWDAYKNLVSKLESIRDFLDHKKTDWLLYKNKKDRKLFLDSIS